MQNLLMSDHTHISGLFDNSLQKSTTEFAAYIILNVLKSENPELAYICFSGDNLVILGELGWLWRHPQHLGASFQHQALHSPLLWGWVNEKMAEGGRRYFLYCAQCNCRGLQSPWRSSSQTNYQGKQDGRRGRVVPLYWGLLLRLLANSKSISFCIFVTMISPPDHQKDIL